MDTSSGARVGVVSCVFVLVTMLLSVTMGILLMVAIRPGRQQGSGVVAAQTYSSYTDIFLDLLRYSLLYKMCTWSNVNTASRS